MRPQSALPGARACVVPGEAGKSTDLIERP